MSKESLSGLAIVSMVGRFPGAPDVDSYWEMIRDGREGISFFTAEELIEDGISPKLVNNPNYVRARGILPNIDRFDARFFGYSPREAEILDPQQRIFLECCWEALEAGGYTPDAALGPVGVYAGSMGGNTYMQSNLLHNAELRENIGDYQIFLANEKDSLATRVAYKLNLRGPAVTVQTGCSTSLVAVAMACQSLIDFQCDLALAGGVAITVPQKIGYLYTPGMIVSPDGHCRAFDAAAKGTLTSSGIGVVLLKRLEDAVRDRDCIVAVIRGWAINNDGADKVGYTAPSVQGQADCIAQALAVAEVEADSIGLVEAHGTGTPMGDPIEVAALAQAFRASTQQRNYCALGSVKTNLGHTETASGVAGLIKAAQAIQHAQLPPSLNFVAPNPEIDFASSPFFVNTKLRPWPSSLLPRRAGVSSFGVGGTNAHVVLEQAPSPAPSEPGRPLQLLVLSARSRTALNAATTNLQRHLQEHPELDLADVAYTLQIGRRAFAHRRILVAADRADAALALAAADPQRLLTAEVEGRAPGVVFMFSGQGSQYVNMCQELYLRERTFAQQVDLCCDYLRTDSNLDLRSILFPAEAQREQAVQQLAQTAVTQPALFVIEYALAKLWMEFGVQPVAMIGHSLGEYVAACLAGVFSLRDALALVVQRGALMQSMPNGAMLAVPLPEEQVRQFLNDELSLAAINGPSHCVVAGSIIAINDLEKRLADQKLRGRRLHTSHAFHSAMMDPILGPFTERVRQVRLNSPQIRYISNVTGRWITPQEATDPAYYARQVRSPVRFSAGVAVLQSEPERVLLEIGPGATLSILAKQHPDPSAKRVILSSLRGADGAQSDLNYLLSTLGRIWLAGCPVNWSAVSKHESRWRVPLPTYPFERERFWVDVLPKVAESHRNARPTSSSLAKPKDSGLDTYFYKPTWRSAPLPQTVAGRAQKNWLLFINGDPLGARLARRLRQLGHAVTTVRAGKGFAHDLLDEYTLDPGQLEDYERLVDGLTRKGHTPQLVVHLWNVGDELAQPSLSALPLAQELAYFSLTTLARALGRLLPTEPLRLEVITSRAARVQPDEPLSRPDRALVSGPCKAIPTEYRNINCQHIDVDSPADEEAQVEALAERLIAEFGAEAPDTQIAYRGLQRFVLQYRSLRLQSPVGELPRLRRGGAYLITGGLGGIGLVLAEYLARSYQAKLLLTSREALPRENRRSSRMAKPTTEEHSERTLQRMRQVATLERLGAEVMVVQADVTDLVAMQAAVDAAVVRLGPIRGVIHSAGVPGGGVIQRRTRQEATAVLAPKVTGTLVLDAIFKERDLDFFILCSSLNSVIGGFGQADYSAANAFLDAFAHHRMGRSRGLTASVNWDAWREVGMAVDAARQRSTSELRSAQQSAPLAHYRELTHPLFDRFMPDDQGAEIYQTRLGGPRRWVLDEHRHKGRPMLPGSVYLELARAAYELHLGAAQPIELRDVVLQSPLVITDGREPEVRTILRRRGSGSECDFTIQSQPDTARNHWQEHASGRLAALAEAPVARHDLERLMRETPMIGDSELAAMVRHRLHTLGPRWQNLVQVRFGRSQGLAFLRLPEGLQDDLRTFPLHPALLDNAAEFITARSVSPYLPSGYRRVRILRPMRSVMYSYVAFEQVKDGGRDQLHSNVTIMDTDGSVLLEIEDSVLVKAAP